MWQPGANDHERRTGLRQLVAARAERRDIFWGEVLHLVYEHRHADANVSSETRHIGEQLQQVDLHVTGVGSSRGWHPVDRWGPALDQLAAARIAPQPEGLQRRQHLTDSIRCSVAYGQLPDGRVQRSGKWSAEAHIRPSLHLSSTPSPVQRLGAQCIQKDCLADASQPGQYQAALRSPPLDPFQGDIECGELRVTASQLWRALACAGRVRVPHRVHVSDRISPSSAFLRFA